MNWPHYKARLTVVDVLECGACIDGVKEWVLKHNAIAGDTASYPTNKHIVRASMGDGNGGGDGNGNGNGYGYGDGGGGDGNGYGYGDGGGGDGYGYGYGQRAWRGSLHRTNHR